MTQVKQPDYSVLDQHQLLGALFHPRPEHGYRPGADNREDMMIPVGKGVQVGASFHFAGRDAPLILFFHGNGEIVADYDDFGALLTGMNINFLVVDYRGYGRSTGTPGVSSMMADCIKILDFVLAYRRKRVLTSNLCVMGRSLGSAPALELCRTRSDDMDSLVIESGFAFISPLLQTLGIDPGRIGFKPLQGFENIDKIKTFSKPCLVIHAQFDHIIPFSEGQALFDACSSTNKILLEIKGANHNDIFMKGMPRYLDHLQQICGS
jgi:hypothetical protein